MSDGVAIFIMFVYGLIGAKAVKYVKYNIFNVVLEFGKSGLHIAISTFFQGILLGWLAIPVALIHWLIVGRNR